MSIKVGFIGFAIEEYERLLKVSEEQRHRGIDNSEEQQIIRSINEKSDIIIDGIKAGSIYGDKIKYEKIPKEFANIRNMWKVRLTGYWRMLYTIDNNNRPEIVAIIFDIMDHEKYNKLFKR